MKKLISAALKRVLSIALLLVIFTTSGAAVFAFARSIHTVATKDMRPLDAQVGLYLVPRCQQQKPLCDLLAY